MKLTLVVHADLSLGRGKIAAQPPSPPSPPNLDAPDPRAWHAVVVRSWAWLPSYGASSAAQRFRRHEIASTNKKENDLRDHVRGRDRPAAARSGYLPGYVPADGQRTAFGGAVPAWPPNCLPGRKAPLRCCRVR